MSAAPLLDIAEVHKAYRLARPRPFAAHALRPALRGVSISVVAGQSFGIVGESGSGKSTLARIALALDRPDSGVVRLEGRSLFELSRGELRAARAHMQLIFQDPYGSLDPRMRVERIVAEPLAALGRASRAERRARVADALEAVGLRASDAAKYPHEFSGGQRQRIAIARALITRPKLVVADAVKYPHEFSGGQRQRIAIARALITRPKLVVADEPVSALDVSVQAQALNLMSDLARDAGVTFLLISHDLGVVAHLCETTAVMFRGLIVEIGPTADLFAAPAHPYARELVDATPRLDRAMRVAPQPSAAPARAAGVGCAYAPRCRYAQSRCLKEAPALTGVAGEGRRAACHFPLV